MPRPERHLFIIEADGRQLQEIAMTMHPTELFWNPAAGPVPGVAAEGDPRAFHRQLPGYATSQVVELPELAARLGIGRITAKKESSRLGLPAFKILGASWATYRELCRRMPELDGVMDLDAIRERLGADASLTFVAATDGNHGRAVAHMARLLGQRSHILVPAGTADARIRAIESEGATVEVVDGTYDDAITKSAAMADATHIVISDTSWEGYRDVPTDVIAGYATIFSELDDQLDDRPTHVFVQLGVGALGGAAIRAAESWEAKVVSVEPEDAACILASLRAGELTEVPGPHRSIMAGLNCGLPSRIAWPTLRAGIDLAVAAPDTAAEAAMRALSDAGVVAGETGAAGLGGLLALASPEAWGAVRERMGLDGESHVLVLITEGATDPASWESITGRQLADSLTT